MTVKILTPGALGLNFRLGVGRVGAGAEPRPVRTHSPLPVAVGHSSYHFGPEILA